MCNFLSQIMGRAYSKGVQEQGLRRICESEREAVTGGWRKRYNDQNFLHPLPNISRLQDRQGM